MGDKSSAMRRIAGLPATLLLVGATVLGCAHVMGQALRDDAKSMFAACAESHDGEKLKCFAGRLEQIIKQDGTERALDVLVEASKIEPWILREGHGLVHHAGWSTIAHYKDPIEAFLHCKPIFASGCYHGVLQAYLAELPKVRPEDLPTLCEKITAARPGTFLKFQCLHGAGHGLALQFELDIVKALEYCDAMSTDWDRESCYGGVFMENVVSTQGHSHHARKDSHAHHDHHHHATATGMQGVQTKAAVKKITGLKDEDLQYPCSAVDKKYKTACYTMQSSAMLTMTGYSFSKAFKACDEAPEAYRGTCYESMGRDISGHALQDRAKAIELCSIGNPLHARHCFIGVAKDMINAAASPEPGVAFCAKVDSDYKQGCYTAVGEMSLDLYADKNRRAEVCASAGENYVAACRAGARLL